MFDVRKRPALSELGLIKCSQLREQAARFINFKSQNVPSCVKGKQNGTETSFEFKRPMTTAASKLISR